VYTDTRHLSSAWVIVMSQ